MKIHQLKSTIVGFVTIFLLAGTFSGMCAQSIEVSGNVSGTWNMDTVNVTGDIQLREVETLNISPGVKIIFRGPFAFEVQGSIMALGSETSPILFTMADTTGFYNDTLPGGGWKNIRIENINPAVDSTIFRYCHFEFGKAVSNDSVYGYGGALCIRNTSRVAIENCVFTSNYAYYNGGAIYLENASIKVMNNYFANNSCGQTFAYYGYGGGICTDWGEPLIMRNTFTENSSTGIGGGMCVRFSDCKVSHNIFIDNYSALGGGFGILHIENCKHIISNNLFTQNGAQFFGAAISNGDCSPTYVNNTIAGNHCDGGGGGFYCKDSVVPVLFNNIIYGNTQFGGEANQVYLWDLLSQPNFYYNDIEGGKENFYGTGGTAYFGEFENNIDEDPLFEPGQFSIPTESPCVDAGNPDTLGLMVPSTDIAGNLRMVNGRLDIGAYENQTPLGFTVQNFQNPVRFELFPNPVKDKLNVSFETTQKMHAGIYVSSPAGKKIFKLHNGTLEAGKHHFGCNLSGNNMQSGQYFVIFENGAEKWVQKFLFVR